MSLGQAARAADTLGGSQASRPGPETGFGSLCRHRRTPNSIEQEPKSSLSSSGDDSNDS